MTCPSGDSSQRELPGQDAPQPVTAPAVEAGGTAGAVTGASAIRGTAWAVGSRLVPQLYVLALSVAAARFLSPDEFGRQSFIAFAAVSATLMLTGGIPPTIVRFAARSAGEGRAGRILALVRWAWRIEIVAATLGGVGLTLVGILGASPATAWIIAGLGCAAGVIQALPSSILLALRLWREAALAGLVTGGLAVPLTIGVLAAGGGITGMFAVETAGAIANLIWVQRLARRALAQVTTEIEPFHEIRSEVYGYAKIMSFAIFLNLVVWQRSEFVFLNWYSTDFQIAVYSIPFALVTGLGRLPDAVNKVTTPLVATLQGAGDSHRIGPGLSRAVRLLILVSLPLTALILALGPAAISLLYGDQYSDAGPVLLVLVAAFPMAPLMGLCTAVLFGIGKLRLFMACNALAAAANIGLDFMFIPSLDAVGAALATVCAQIIAGLPLFFFVSRLFGPIEWHPRLSMGVLLSSAAAAGGGRAVLELTDGAPGFFLAAAVSLACLLVAARVLGVMTEGDVDWLTEATGARTRRLFDLLRCFTIAS